MMTQQRRVSMACACACAALALALPLEGSARPDEPGDDWETVFYDGLDEHGRLVGGRLFLPRVDLSGVDGRGDGSYETVLDNGPSANRIDMVTVGDGYLAGQLGAYEDHVIDAIADLFSIEPFTTYATFFNVHRVDVVSNESGVDHDPTFPTWRDTALDMGFWCNNTERLLCVDVAAAYAFAAGAPDVDHVLAIANSTKYGGAGYTGSDLATFSGGNASSTQVAIHEIGHSLGNLADEYSYGGPQTYNGGERPEPNVSILRRLQMRNQGTKWAAWIDHNDPDYDGLVSTYEGAYYSEFGIYRPTNDSMMRSLGRPFNPPSIESLVIEFYKIVSPIDDSTPTGNPLDESDVVFVDVVQPVDSPLTIKWFLDGERIPDQSGDTLDLLRVDMPNGQRELTVEVVDNTRFVRDEDARDQWMTDTRTWTIEADAVKAALNAVTVRRGTLEAGGPAQARTSNDAYVRVLSQGAATKTTEVQYDLNMPPAPAGPLAIRIESHINRPSGTITVLAWNYQTQAYDSVGAFPVKKADKVRLIEGLDAAKYRRASNGDIRLRIRHTVTGGTFPSFKSYQDQVVVVAQDP